MQNKLIAYLIVLAVIGSLAYFSYSQVRANGKLSEQLEDAKKANAEWDRIYKDTVGELNKRQERLDAAVKEDTLNREKAKAQDKLFRQEIDKLKASNSEYKRILSVRIPDPLLIRMCEAGRATAELCENLL